jgi:hypothetical protein
MFLPVITFGELWNGKTTGCVALCGYPRELATLGMREYRQLYLKPYRVIYRIIGQRVYIYLIADERREMASLLTLRLHGGR